MGVILESSGIIKNMMSSDTNQTISSIKFYSGDKVQCSYNNGWETLSSNKSFSMFFRYDEFFDYYLLFRDKNDNSKMWTEARPFRIHKDENFFYTMPSDNFNSILTTLNIGKQQTGFVKFGNGIIIQWGGLGENGTLSKTITFPIPFSNTNYVTNLGFVIVNNGRQLCTKYTSYMVTGYDANSSAIDDWIAIGY